MKITFTEMYNTEIGATIPKELVLQIVKGNENIYLSELGGTILFFCSHVFVEESYILIVIGFIENEDYKVYYGFKFLVDDVNEYSTMDSINIFRNFVKKYGLNIKIGYVKDIFIHHQTFWVKSNNPNEIVQIENPENNSFIQNIIVKINKRGSKNRIDCHLGFCINKDQYLNDIK